MLGAIIMIMNAHGRPSGRTLVGAGAAWIVLAASMIGMLVLQVRLSDADRNDLIPGVAVTVLFLIPLISATVVGSALVVRRPYHPVGWLLLLLAVAIGIAGAMDDYVAYGAVARPGALPGVEVIAVIATSMFIPWLVLLALVLLLTPSGRLTSRITRVAGGSTLLGGTAGFAVGLLRPYEGDFASLGTIRNPLEVTTASEVLAAIRLGGVVAVHLGVLVGVAAIIVRFRAAQATERSQLRWLGMTAIPFALLVFGSFVAATLEHDIALSAFAGCFLAVIPVVIGLSIERHHLYDVDRLVSRAVTWLLLSAAVVGTYVVVVIFVGQSIGQFGDSELPAVVATLAAASVAAPLRGVIQDTLDRRFNRRRFEALAMLRAFSRDRTPSTTVEQAMRTATRHHELSFAYWIEQRQAWFSEDGLPMTPAADGVTVRRQGQPVCVIGFNPTTLDRPTVEAAAAEVLVELENARLRAAITLQLVEVRESRYRIVEAQMTERHRIERDLHDGAQQRLLGLAMRLRAAQLSGDAEQVQATAASAIDELQTAVRELRELANGLRPATLVDGGLAAALDDLAARSPVAVDLRTTSERFPPRVEETAWFIACEAMANAVKHAAPREISITAEHIDNRLRLVIADDGIGGADPTGQGLRGIADRAEAASGTLRVQSCHGHGTILTVDIPCA